MKEEHIRVIKAFEDHGIKFTERQKEIAGEAYDKVINKHKCDRCEDEADFYIYNSKKKETMKYCSLHFWIFCKKMGEHMETFKDSLPKIKELLGGD